MRVLVVEDEKTIAEEIASALTDAGYVVDIARREGLAPGLQKLPGGELPAGTTATMPTPMLKTR